MVSVIISFFSSILGVSAPVVVIILPILLVIVIYTLVTGRSFTMILADKTFSFGGKQKQDKKEVAENEDSCATCVKKELYVERAKYIVKEHLGLAYDLKRNLFIQQMNFAEEKVAELRILICRVYSRRLAQILQSDVIQAKATKDYKLYRMVIYHIMLQNVKDDIIKKALKENHFLELTESEFKQYKSRKSNLIVDEISERLDVLYSTDCQISREEVFSLNEGIKVETVEIIHSIFDNAREVSRIFNGKIMEHQKKTEQQLEEV